MNAAAVLDVLATAARSEPAKIVARKTGISPRHVRNIAHGHTDTGVTTAIAFAKAYPPVRAFFREVLALEDGPLDPEFSRKMSEAAQAWIAAQARRK